MNHTADLKESKKTARVAGIWYLVLAICSGATWMYLNRTFVPENAALTARNISSTEFQYILSIIASITGQIAFVFVALYLYRLLKNVNMTQARFMITLVFISVALMFVNILFQTGSLVILERTGYFAAFTKDQVAELSTLLLHLNLIGVYIADLFWGLWLFPLAYLAYRSGLFPEFISYALVLSGIGYITDSFSFIINQELHSILRNYLSIPEALGEVILLLWLLIKGVSVRKE